MKRNNKLQYLADQSLSDYHNEDVANEIKVIIKSNKQNSVTKSNKRKAVFWSSIATAAVAAMIIALIIFIPMPNSGSNDKIYSVGNQVTLNADLESLNNDLSHFKFSTAPDAFIIKTVDTYYNETLYYSIDISHDSGKELKIFVVTNKDYKSSFNHAYNNKYNNTYRIGGYILSYSESFELIEPDLYYVETYGELITKNEKLYFSYNDITLEESSHFMECIQQIITVK